jgi:hypothetical protein
MKRRKALHFKSLVRSFIRGPISHVRR